MNLSNTKALDSDGLPLALYRGEHGLHDHLVQTRMGSITFGSQKAAEHYALSPNVTADVVYRPRVLQAHLAITNPIFNQPRDPLIDYSDLVRVIGTAPTQAMFVQFEEYVRHTNAWERLCETSQRQWGSVQEVLAEAPELMADLCVLCYVLLDYRPFVELARWLGYDGAIYQGSGETLAEAEYRVFDQQQIVFIEEYEPS